MRTAMEFRYWIPTPFSSGQQQLELPFKDTHYPSEKMACCLVEKWLFYLKLAHICG
jgi:hypothetical protein